MRNEIKGGERGELPPSPASLGQLTQLLRAHSLKPSKIDGWVHQRLFPAPDRGCPPLSWRPIDRILVEKAIATSASLLALAHLLFIFTSSFFINTFTISEVGSNLKLLTSIRKLTTASTRLIGVLFSPIRNAPSIRVRNVLDNLPL